MAFEMGRKWGIDCGLYGGQKACHVSGISLVGFFGKPWQHIEARKDQLKHWCWMQKLADQFWVYKKSYHLYLRPFSGILAIHESPATGSVSETLIFYVFDRPFALF